MNTFIVFCAVKENPPKQHHCRKLLVFNISFFSGVLMTLLLGLVIKTIFPQISQEAIHEVSETHIVTNAYDIQRLDVTASPEVIETQATIINIPNKVQALKNTEEQLIILNVSQTYELNDSKKEVLNVKKDEKNISQEKNKAEEQFLISNTPNKDESQSNDKKSNDKKEDSYINEKKNTS